MKIPLIAHFNLAAILFPLLLEVEPEASTRHAEASTLRDSEAKDVDAARLPQYLSPSRFDNLYAVTCSVTSNCYSRGNGRENGEASGRFAGLKRIAQKKARIIVKATDDAKESRRGTESHARPLVLILRFIFEVSCKKNRRRGKKAKKEEI